MYCMFHFSIYCTPLEGIVKSWGTMRRPVLGLSDRGHFLGNYCGVGRGRSRLSGWRHHIYNDIFHWDVVAAAWRGVTAPDGFFGGLENGTDSACARPVSAVPQALCRIYIE